MRSIPLANGKGNALVDDEDYENLMRYKWHINPGGYAVRSNNIGSRVLSGTLMARQIIEAPRGVTVDHINHNKLDNRRANLRLATNSENLRNRAVFSRNASGYKGVSLRKGNSIKKWRATATIDSKHHHIGLFETPEEAHKAYVDFVKPIYGEYYYQNN